MTRPVRSIFRTLIIASVAILSATVLMSLSEDVSAADLSGTAGPNVTWSYDDTTETLTLTGTGTTYAYSSGARPPWVQASYSVKNVVIEEGISSLGANLFAYDPELESVTLPSTLRTIGESAFRGTGITDVEIPPGVTEIMDHAFRGTKLTSVTIPAGVTVLRTYVFAETCIEHVTIPSTVRTLDTGAFATSALLTIDIEEGVTTLRLTGCDSITELIVPNSVTVLRVDCKSLETVVLGTGMAAIPESCFNGCISLYEITFNDSITQFNVRAFSGTPSLLSIEVPKNLRTLQVATTGPPFFQVTGRVFDGSSINYISVHPENQYYESRDGVLYTKGLGEIVYPGGGGEKPVTGTAGPNINWVSFQGTITFSGTGPMRDYIDSDSIPWKGSQRYAVFEEGITYIGNYAMSQNAGMFSVSLPSTLEGIGECAFRNTSITQIDIPDGVKSIDNMAFSNTKLTSVVIPDSVTHLGNSVFQKCANIISVTIGGGVTNINQGLVADTPLLEEFILSEGVTHIQRWVTNNSGLMEVYLPSSVVWVHREAFGAGSGDPMENIHVDKDNRYYSSDDGILFSKDKSEIIRFLPGRMAVSYTIPEGVISIAPYAFYRCSSLKTLVISDGVEYIGRQALGLCTGIVSLTIPASVTQIDKNGVNTGSKMEYLYVGGGIKTLTSSTIPAIKTVSELHIGEGVSRIDLNALKTNLNLRIITVDQSNPHFTSINGSLYNKEVTELLAVPSKTAGHFMMPDTVKHIGNSVFAGTSITSITLSDSLNTIGEGAFSKTAITTIRIPGTVWVIGDDAFKGCSDVVSIYFEGNSPPSMGENAFDTGSEMRVYSSMTPGFIDPYLGATSLSSVRYLDADRIYTDTMEMLMDSSVYILLAFLITSISLIIAERVISKRTAKK